MACKCFDYIILTEGLSLKEKLSLCKCKCNARFSAEENKQVFILADAAIEDVEKHKIDDGIIKDTINNKCDYLFVYKNRKFFFVELKGSDIRHALTQIKASMQFFYKEGIINNTKDMRCCIVFTSYPKDNGTFRKEVIALKKDWKNKVASIEVYQKSKRMEYSVSLDKVLG
nr:hypothetical protein [uncultured Bacteroides sp.]